MCIRNYLTLLFVIVGCVLTFTNSEYRMVGGSDGNVERTPYVVLIRYLDANHCVGSLVTWQKVVTTADCVVDKQENLFSVAAGITDLHGQWENGQVRGVQSLAYPPEYKKETKDMNIAVMTLDRLINKCPTVDTIGLCRFGILKVLVGRFGWEHAKNGEISYPIKFTEWSPVYPNDCEKLFRSPRIPFTESMFCYSAARPGGCLVDPGTPGVVMGRLCLVASHYLNRDPNSPIVFTVVTSVRVEQFLYKELKNHPNSAERPISDI